MSSKTASALRATKRVQDRYSGKLYRVRKITGTDVLLQNTDGGRQTVSVAEIESDFRIL